MIICSIISIDWAGKKKVLVHAAVFNAQCTTPLQSGESECLEHTHTHKVETHIIIHLHLQFVISSGCNNVERGGAPLLTGGGGGVLGRGSQGGHQRHGHARSGPWNNGKEVSRWGVAEIQKMSPSTTDIIVVTNSPPIGLMRSQLTNHQIGIVLAVRAWS